MWSKCEECAVDVEKKEDKGGRVRDWCPSEEKFMSGPAPEELECFVDPYSPVLGEPKENVEVNSAPDVEAANPYRYQPERDKTAPEDKGLLDKFLSFFGL